MWTQAPTTILLLATHTNSSGVDVKRTIELITRTEVTIDVHDGTLDDSVNSITLSPAIIGGSFSYSANGPCYSTADSKVELIEWSVIK